MQFSLAAQSTGVLPFAIGFAFRQGDVPSGRHVTTSLPEAQATIKNAWPDGSAKFAIIAGRASLVAGSTLTVAVSSATAAPSGVALSTADLKATGVTAGVGCGGFGSVNWSGADWDAPFRTWVSGPQMSSWIYRKPVGTDAHLVAWLEVRLYAGGAVEVLPWIENGYVAVASPTNKSATYTFSLGGTQRFAAAVNLLSHQRTPLIAGSSLSYWLGPDPAVTPRHNMAYLQSTRLVPNYRAVVAANAAAASNQPSTYQPLQQGSMPAGMGGAGYHPSIGLLPEWDVLYMTCSSNAMWGALQRNAYSAGRYGIHFRDENTNLPLRFSQYPNLVLDSSSGVVGTGASSRNLYTPAASGGGAPAYNSTHCPAMGYFAYLATGRLYHLETLQFQATLHFLKNTDTGRSFSAGVLLSSAGANTVRGAAWALRTLAQALCATPDGDALQAELKASYEANINYYHARYVAQASNPLGVVQPYSDYTGVGDGQYFEAAWQQDFFTAAVGMAQSLGLPLSSDSRDKLGAFFAWKAKSIVGRLGGTSASEYLYRDAAPYTFSIAPSDSPDYSSGAGPWHANWGQCYEATVGSGARTAGDLRGGNFPEATSYWGNLQPAIAYAVEHNVPGAAEGYARMTGASNWAQLTAAFNADPVWSVRP
jgi:hypothetical protein